ncbi:MAG: ABC transporter permease [Actinomycetia bacterium]|nr:ABC transporter permease [Actinomycetes bacterium]MCP3909764.1 ABC transporter permease [Actinomycetes bacterium]MCP4084006.1 ABC transporter permease [Actinomycetes bacterium]
MSKSAVAGPPSLSAFLVMARRAVVGFFRQPASWVFGGLFPLLITAVSASAFSRATDLPGFPDSRSFLQFLMAGTILQGVLFGSIEASTDLALDIENGFMDRLLASPVSRVSILISRLAGAAAYGAGVTLFYVAVFAMFDATVEGGIGGVLVMIVLMMTMAIGVGGYGAALGLRTGSVEAVGNSFPLIFILLFISSAFFPVQTMSGLYRRIAELNPITFVIDSVRHQVLVGFDLGEAAVGLLVAVLFATATITLALTQLRRRLADAS